MDLRAGQPAGGWVVDRFGSRVMYAVALLTWSSFTLLQGFAGRFATLFGLRLGVGIAEAPTFPINNRVVSIWFAQRERGIATSVYLVGQYVGMAALTPVLFWIAGTFGWREIFFATASSASVAGVWYLLYRDPEQCKWANDAELEHIRTGGAVVEIGKPARGEPFRGASSRSCSATARSSRSARANSRRYRRCISS
nr:MFS transporter [Burkholderia cenocepacia]